MPAPIAIDITETVADPIRTGIQRVVRELLRHWPAAIPAIPCRYDLATDALVELPREAVEILCETAPELREAPVEALRSRLATAIAQAPTARIPDGVMVFNPELFGGRDHSLHYNRRLEADPQGSRFLAYDFIPWLRPDLMPFGRAQAIAGMWYLRALAAAERVSFISTATRDDFAGRIRRQPDFQGPVLPLGADGLGVRPRPFDRGRRTLLCIGSIDGRKRQEQVVDAFRALRAEGAADGAELVLVGRAVDQGGALAKGIEAAAAAPDSGIRWVRHATDQEVAALLAQARATVYASENEGFGLPPVESLFAGVPVVVGSHLPSTRDLPPLGQVRLPEVTGATLAAAMRRVLDDAEAEALWRDAADLSLPTWRDFAAAAADWAAR
ncbi:glycosyltransferase [Roseomonas sp. BN140053]|uniref:glycosyltransferase n=1 Tax=Roseomonas sp. BN140053 TaxID=3391898 RepID=UPI0039EC983F